ncbi:MAG: flagellar basal body-associated FliL family protein [Synergistaceae bacterium]|jgi:flagellar basal body-associated protein FliL|nr:flagellar basal body-associated FliL family protein [Synergistaceae bacterium]
MALAKRTLIFVIIGVVVLAVGVAGGVYLTRFLHGNESTAAQDIVLDPGPMIELGQFSSTLADQQMHIVRLKITVEISDIKVYERLNTPGWIVMMKDEIIKTLKDQRYDVIRFTEGMEKLKQDMKTRLNAILPRDNGVASIKKVLFDEYMTQ